MTTTLEFCNELKNIISCEDESIKNNNVAIEFSDSQIKMLYELFLAWKKRFKPEDIKKMIIDILKRPNIENGKVYEALVYAWLEKQNINFIPQSLILQENCFKASNQGYYADGIIKENNIIFDVKQFGIDLPHIETLRRKLQEKLPEDYYFTISGGKNISAKDLHKKFLVKMDKIAKRIMSEEHQIHGDYIYYENEYGFEFRAWDRKNNPIFTSISEFNPYQWAENNQFYFIHHASQFCKNSPYILFCPYDTQLAPLFSRENDDLAFQSFRALSRRIFMNLTKLENRKIIEFDGKAQKDISVATAAKKISAIIFIDVSYDFNYSNCRMFVFQNPNADLKIPLHQIKSLFGYAGAAIEDFEYDNY